MNNIFTCIEALSTILSQLEGPTKALREERDELSGCKHRLLSLHLKG